MAYPKVSILWVNYNSKKIIDIVLESLFSVLDLNYPNYELIVVDNGSKDGSFDIIKHIIESRTRSNIRVKLIRLKRNKGFNAANNIAFQARDKTSKYIVLLNNDATLTQDGLLNLVEIMESEEAKRIAAAQGIITTWDGTKVDNMGFIVDELLFVHALYRGYSPHSIKKPHYCTFVSGACSIYLVDAIKKINKEEILFDGHMFAYFDDKVIGFKLWYNGFRVKSFPIITSKHFGSASFGKLTSSKLYLTTRNFLVLCKATEHLRYKPIIMTGYPLRRLAEILFRTKNVEWITERLFAFSKALLQVNVCSSLVNYNININRVPILRLNLIKAFKNLISESGDKDDY